MKNKIIGIFLCALLIGTVIPSISGFNLPKIRNNNPSVSSFSDDNTFDDYTDDVICLSINNEDIYRTDEKPNINIISGSYSINDDNATLKLEVEGIIEDRGNIIPENIFENIVFYNFHLNTSKNYYDILYCNGSCILEYDTIPENLSNFVVDGSILSVTFSLNNTSETFNSIIIETLEFNIKGLSSLEIYFDIATNIEYSIDIEITKPDSSLYVLNRKILPLPSPVVIGKIDVEYRELLNETKTGFCELYIDGELIATPSFYYPNNILIWNKLSFGKHTLKVIAFDQYGNRASDEMIVWKFF